MMGFVGMTPQYKVISAMRLKIEYLKIKGNIQATSGEKKKKNLFNK